MPVAIGGTATGGCSRVLCDMNLPFIGMPEPDVVFDNALPLDDSVIQGARHALLDSDDRWGFFNRHDPDNMIFQVVMPADSTEDSPTEFALQMYTELEYGGADASMETMTIQLDTRPSTSPSAVSAVK